MHGAVAEERLSRTARTRSNISSTSFGSFLFCSHGTITLLQLTLAGLEKGSGMSSAYFLTLLDPTSRVQPSAYLQIDPLDYAQKLHERWPAAAIKSYEQDANETYNLRFDIPSQNIPNWHLLGGLQRNSACVTFESVSKEDICSFVLWHRSVVPISQPMFLWKGSDWQFVLEITATTTGQDIATFAGWPAQ